MAILHIFHGQVNKVPKRLPKKRGDLVQVQLSNYDEPKVGIDVPYQITVASDKYYVTHLLKPWARSWIDQHGMMFCERVTKRIWIAWVLGDRSLLISGLQNVAFYVYPTHKTDDFTRLGGGHEAILRILNISEKIRSARAVAMKAVLEPVCIYLDDTLAFIGPECAWHMEAAGPGSDRDATLTAFRETLAQYQLYPLPDHAETWTRSLFDLQRCLSYAIRDCWQALDNLHLQHPGCKPLDTLSTRMMLLEYDPPLIQLDGALEAHLKQRQLETGV